MPEGIERETSRVREVFKSTKRAWCLRRRSLSIERLEPRLVLAGISVSSSQVLLGSFINDTAMGVNAVATGDLNGDGKIDLVASWSQYSPTTGTPAVYVALGNGNGTFASAAKLTDNGRAVSFGAVVGATLGDVTGDGILDVVTLSGAVVTANGLVADTIRVFRGLGTGAFQSWSSLTLPRYAADFAVMDVTGDGKLDLVTVHPETQAIAVFPGVTAGFGSAVETSTSGWTPYRIRKANLDGDQFADGAVLATDASGLAFALTIRATSTGSFTVDDVALPAPAGWTVFAVGEVNGDARDDVVIAAGSGSLPSSDKVRVFRNNGSGAFSASNYNEFGVSDYPSIFPDVDDVSTGVAIADFNKDGRGDIFVTKHRSQVSVFYLQNPDGSFSSSAVASLTGYDNPCVADINGDATPDVLVGQLSLNRVSAFVVTQQTPASVPGAPTGVAGTAGNGQVSLTWAAPSSNGGASITGYVVQYKTTAASIWTTFSAGTSTSTSATVTGLQNGTGYVFQVAAVNSVGTGSYSTASSTITPVASATSPGAPTGVAGTAGNSQVALSWTAPSSNGGAAITDYVIQHSSNSGSTWTTFSDGTSTATSTTVTGLVNGTGYIFRVAAVNSSGEGGYSASSSTITPATTPGAPTSLTGTAGNGQVSLSWTAPSSNGGAAITDYVVRYSSNSGSSWTTFNDGSSTATSAVVTGLTNGTGYVFQVAAVNSTGTGSYSTASSTITPVSPTAGPGGPTGVAGTAGNSQVALSWTAPTSNGGAAITDYVVRYSSNSGSSWTTLNDGSSTATSVTVTGLTNGTGYIFQVAATNSVGTGSYSASSSTITPATTPGAPTGLTGTAGNQQVSLSWTAPSSNGGAAITDYVIQYSANGGSAWTTFDDGTSTAPSAVITSLTNGTGYVFQVKAVNSAQTGAYSVASSVITPFDQSRLPAKPQWLTVYAAATSVRLSWQSSSTTPSQYYRVSYYNTYRTKTWTVTTSLAPSITLAGLETGRLHLFKVEAINEFGASSETWASASPSAVVSSRQNLRPVVWPATVLSLSGADLSRRPPIGQSGIAVSELFAEAKGAFATDRDSSTLGLAITGTATRGGTLWYSINSGATWFDIKTVSDANALLLFSDARTRLYYQPPTSAVAGGNLTAIVSIKAWDRSNGVINGSFADTRSTFSPAITSNTSMSGISSSDLIGMRDGTVAAGIMYDENGGKFGVALLDMTRPWSLSAITTFPVTPSSGAYVLSLAASADGNTLYIGTDRGIQVVDITVIEQPRLISLLNLPYPSYGLCRDICLTPDGRFIVAADDSSMCIIDISDPQQPTVSGFLAHQYKTHRVQVSSDGLLAYVGRYGGGGVDVVDISNRTMLKKTATLTSTPTWALAASVEGRTVLVGDGSTVKIFDVSSAVSPRLVASLTMVASVNWIKILSDKRTALVSCGDVGIYVVDFVSASATVIALLPGTGDTSQVLQASDYDTLILHDGLSYNTSPSSFITYSLRDLSQYSIASCQVDVVVASASPDWSISVADGQQLAFGYSHGGSGSLFKAGAGSLTLTSENTHSGGTFVESGVLVVRNSAALGTGQFTGRAGATVKLELANNQLFVGSLALDEVGRIDLGTSRISVPSDGYSLSAVIGLLQRGHASNWTGASGVGSSVAQSIRGGGVGYFVDAGGSLTFGFAAAGDTNLDGIVDILDVSAMLVSGKFNTGESASWSEGDFNYDGAIDILDIAAMLSPSLYDAGSYMPAPAAQAESSSASLSAIDSAFLAWAAGTTTDGAAPPKKVRLVKA